MLIEMVETELGKRKQEGKYKGEFKGQSHFFGYFILFYIIIFHAVNSIEHLYDAKSLQIHSFFMTSITWIKNSFVHIHGI
jgi:hypothetical protein